MRAVRLLEYALTKEPQTVLDVGGGQGSHAISFLAHGCRVTGLDVREPKRPLQHPLYEQILSPYEKADLGDRKFDMVWCSHTLEHVPNVQHFLIFLRHYLKEDGYLAIAVPTSRQNRIHIGHLSLWTPAHLIYNLICAGWDCKKSEWYTEYLSIGLIVQKTAEIDLSWRTSLPSEIFDLNRYTPKSMHHEDGAWWGNNWPEPFESNRIQDPPFVTIGHAKTSMEPEIKLAFGPNPALRKRNGTQIT
jgi:SAM-dependent methyltransferase